MIVVMGASGRVGGAALESIVDRGKPVRAVGRHIPAERHEAVDWVKADAIDTAALAKAFDGAEAVFVLNPVSSYATDVHVEADHLSSSIAEALSVASVPYAVALSSQGAHLAQGTGVVATLHRFEAALRSTDIELTILRPAYFIESWIPLAQVALKTNEFPSFLTPSSRAIDAVSARDVGIIAAQYLLKPAPGVVNIVGPARYSDTEAADVLAEIHHRPVSLNPVPEHQVAAAHEAAGMGSSLSAEMAAMYRAINGAGIPFEDALSNYITGNTTLRDILSSTILQ